MTILTILLVLLIDRVLCNADPYREFHWLNRYFHWIGKWHWLQSLASRPTATGIQLLPLLLFVAWLQSIFHDGWNGLLELAFGVTVLLLSLGPEDLQRAIEEDNHIGENICPQALPVNEPSRSLAVARCLLVEANNRLFAPIFWFLLLGPVGAVAYRSLYQYAEWRQATPGHAQSSPDNTGLLQFFADWIPARITALGYAVAGNFEAVIQAWQTYGNEIQEKDIDAARNLLCAAGPAALDSFPSDEELENMSDAPPVIEDAMALIWRTLSLWIVILILGGAIFWLA